VQLPLIRRAWAFPSGRFFTAREQRNAVQTIVLGSVVAQRLFGAANPVGQDVTIWNQPFRVAGVVTSTSWVVAPAPGDGQFDAVYVPFTTVHRLLNVSKLNDITITAASTGDVTRVSKDNHRAAACPPRHRAGRARRFHGRDPGAPGAREGRSAAPTSPAPSSATVAGLEKVTLDQLAKTARAREPDDDRTAGEHRGGVAHRWRDRIMNIMLLSVTERTREIGVRRAVRRARA